MLALTNLARRLLLRGAGGRSAIILLFSLVVAVAVVTCLMLTTDRLNQLIYSKASSLLAADATISGSQPIPEVWLQQAQTQNLAQASVMGFRAMVFGGGDALQLGAVKAVDSNYPLKGELLISTQPFGQSQARKQGPAPGEAWLISRLFAALGIEIGDNITIGNQTFTVTAALIQEPDNPQGVMGFAPRVMIHRDDVAATGSIAPGSRVNYKAMFAGAPPRVSAFEEAIAPDLGEHFRWQAAGEGDGPDASVFNRITGYVILVGSLALLLGAVAIALAAEEFARAQNKSVALLKTLGLGPRKIMRLYSLQLAMLLLTGCLLGSLLGWLAHSGLLFVLRDIIPFTMPQAQWQAWVIPLAGGAALLLAFAGPRFWALRKVLPVAAIHQNAEVAASAQNRWLGAAVILVLVALISQQLKMTLLAAVGLALVFFSVRYLIALSTRFLTKLHARLKGAWRLGLGQWLNYRWANATQATVFGLIFMVLFTVYGSRTALLSTWQQQVPADAPNHFVFNIYDHQKNAVQGLIEKTATNLSAFYPMARGRVTAVNDLSWKQQLEASPTQNSMNYERELNLSWTQQLQQDNKIIEGQWWSDSEANIGAPLEVSIEKEYAAGANIQIGDTLTVSLAGQTASAKVTSIRTLNWQSMRPNFFILFNRAPVEYIANQWITSFYLPPEQKLFVNDLVSAFPSVTLIEIDQTIERMQGLISQLGMAVEYLLVLIVLAALAVLVASLQASLATRLRLAAVMRAFGAAGSLVNRSLWVEFCLLGLVAGFVGCLGAEAIIRLWLVDALELPGINLWQVWFLGLPLAVGVLGFFGWLGVRRVIKMPPAAALKAG